jgi:hypothetical protein
MAEAVAATGRGPECLDNNPAGISGSGTWAAAGYQRLPLEVQGGWAGAGLALGQGGLAVGLRQLDYGMIQDNVEEAGGGIRSADYRTGALAGSLTGAAPVWAGGGLNVGAQLIYWSEDLGLTRQAGFSGSMGFQSRPKAWNGAALGASLERVGSAPDGQPLPTALRMGMGWAGEGGRAELGCALPANGTARYMLGLEYRPARAVALRGGWQSDNGTAAALDQGLSAGVGIQIGNAQLDYSAASGAELGNSHRLSLSWLFTGR